jgi:hypothetical protein
VIHAIFWLPYISTLPLKTVAFLLTYKIGVMIIKLFNSALILFAAYMGINQGIAMVIGKPEMLAIFVNWHFGKAAVMIMGAVAIVSSLLILFPGTFLWGNFLMAAGILFILCLQLWGRNLKGAFIELPYLLVNLIILYFQHPLAG